MESEPDVATQRSWKQNRGGKRYQRAAYNVEARWYVGAEWSRGLDLGRFGKRKRVKTRKGFGEWLFMDAPTLPPISLV